ncbi:MAG: hypothetical protein EBS75_00275 [Betaproteobacteria bacterium]|nr:hypothetical protein [Betaproteobacteria bacterium]
MSSVVEIYLRQGLKQKPSRIMIFGLLFSLTYVMVDWMSYIYPIGDLNITPWNPPAALQVLFLTVMGRRWFLWIYLSLCFSDVLVRQADATP